MPHNEISILIQNNNPYMGMEHGEHGRSIAILDLDLRALPGAAKNVDPLCRMQASFTNNLTSIYCVPVILRFLLNQKGPYSSFLPLQPSLPLIPHIMFD